MRALALLALGAAAVASTAYGAETPDIVRLSKPAFPPPLSRVMPVVGPRLVHVSTTRRAPGLTPRPEAAVQAGAPAAL